MRISPAMVVKAPALAALAFGLLATGPLLAGAPEHDAISRSRLIVESCSVTQKCARVLNRKSGSTFSERARAPRLSITDLKQLPTPLPRPYDESATPSQVGASVDAAFARARAHGKRVVIDFGGNWCSWCRMLTATMDLPQARPFIQAHFEVVNVAASLGRGKTNHNLRIVHRFGLGKIAGFPWLVVVEPDGKVLSSSYEVTDEHHQTPQRMIDWFARWARPTAVARTGAVTPSKRSGLHAAANPRPSLIAAG